MNDRKTIRMSPDLIKKINKIGKKQNRTFSNVVVTILLNHFKKTNQE
jgi:predicted transcriptional regulator